MTEKKTTSPFYEKIGPVYILPICHYRIEFAHLVRQAIDQLRPEAIAVELPETLRERVEEGVSRLPLVSVLLYENRNGESVYLVIEPADPLVEAIRMGKERGIPVFFVDVDADDYPLFQDPLPDPYAILRLGHKTYYEEFRNRLLPHLSKSPQDRIREQGMAYYLKEITERFSSILFVCGMVHLDGVRRELSNAQAQPLGRIKRQSIQLFNLHPDSVREVLATYPFLSAIYELHRSQLPPEPSIDLYTVRKTLKVSPFGIIDGGKIANEEEALNASLIWSARRVLHVSGSMIDKQKAGLRLFEQAARHYKQDTGEEVTLWQKKGFFAFSRNYTLIDGLLLPDFFHMITAAKGCVDDNFGYALWRLGTYYPWIEDISAIPTLKISAEQIFFGSRKIRIRRRLHRPRKHVVRIPMRKRPKEGFPGEWLEEFKGDSLCSYPPEDIVIENYGNFLKKKGGKLLSEEQSRIIPMVASLLDGIDLRETIRHLPEKRIYVREDRVVKGAVGSVVVIYDEDEENKKFTFSMTWHGENEQESDMAFYATDPADHIVGPGICRCEYGGFLLSYPPLRMIDVWSDPEYRFFNSKPEKLLIAALDYSLERFVVYVASRPPRSTFRTIASRMEKQIIYIPIGTLSPVQLKKIRVFHILSGHDKRSIAKDYLW